MPTIENSDEQIAEILIGNIKDRSALMEATGGYESRLVDLLHQAAIAVAVVNPRRMKKLFANHTCRNRPGQRPTSYFRRHPIGTSEAKLADHLISGR